MVNSFVPVIVATVISFIFGFLWYGPLFGKYWMSLMGFTKQSTKKMKMTATTAMILGFISTFVMAYVLSLFITTYNFCGSTVGSFLPSLEGGFIVWLGFAATLSLGTVLWEGKPWKLWFFNNIYNLINIELIVVALNLCYWYL